MTFDFCFKKKLIEFYFHRYKLIKAGFDVRGIFDGYGFIFSPDNLSLKSYLPDAVSLGKPQALSYIVIQEVIPFLFFSLKKKKINNK